MSLCTNTIFAQHALGAVLRCNRKFKLLHDNVQIWVYIGGRWVYELTRQARRSDVQQLSLSQTVRSCLKVRRRPRITVGHRSNAVRRDTEFIAWEIKETAQQFYSQLSVTGWITLCDYPNSRQVVWKQRLELTALITRDLLCNLTTGYPAGIKMLWHCVGWDVSYRQSMHMRK